MINLKVHPLTLLSVWRVLPLLLLVPTLYLKLAFSGFLVFYGILLVIKKRVLFYKDRVTVENGVFIKRKCIIKKENISAFCIERGPLSYLFGAATLKLYTKAEKSGAHAQSMRIYKNDINTVYEYFEVCDSAVSIKTGFLKILFSSVATSSAVLGFFFAVPFFRRAEKLFGVGVSSYLFEKIGEISEDAALPTVSGTITLLLFVFYFVSLTVNLCKSVFSKTKDGGNAFSHTRGFPVFKKTIVSKTAVSSLSFRRPFVLRLFGRGQIAVPSSAYAVGEAPLPNIKANALEAFAPCLQTAKRHKSAHKNTLYRFLRWRLIMFSLFFLLYRVLVLLFPLFSQFVGFLCFCLAVLLFYLVLLAFYAYKTAWIAEDREKITVNAVCGFSVKRVVFCKKDITEIKIIRYPTDKKQGTCTVKITAHPTGESAKIKYITDNFLGTGEDCKKGAEKC